MTDYRYIFTYQYDGKEITMAFPADITLNDLMNNFKDFLKACSWREDTIEEYFFNEETDVRKVEND